ncbi:hypothetical protein HMPREF1599_00466, partial [Escherichia coli 907713]
TKSVSWQHHRRADRTTSNDFLKDYQVLRFRKKNSAHNDLR